MDGVFSSTTVFQDAIILALFVIIGMLWKIGHLIERLTSLQIKAHDAAITKFFAARADGKTPGGAGDG